MTSVVDAGAPAIVGDPFAHVRPLFDHLRALARPARLVRIAPSRRVIAFSRRDARSPRFADAVAVAEECGFAAAVRPVGGTFAPLHTGSLVVDEFGYSGAEEWPNPRFDRHAGILLDVFRGYGIDARIGEVPGEYCPGAHSVNLGGFEKLSGSAQRVSGRVWLVSSVVQVGSVEPLLEVTTRVAEALGLDIDASVTGALTDALPGLTIDGVAARIAAAFQADGAELVVAAQG